MSAAEWEMDALFRPAVTTPQPRTPHLGVPSSSTISHGSLAPRALVYSGEFTLATGRAWIAGHALVTGNSYITGNTVVGGKQLVTSNTYAMAMNLRPVEPILAGRSEWAQTSPLLQYRDERVVRAHRAIEELIAPIANREPEAHRLHRLVELAMDDYPETDVPSFAAIATLRQFFIANLSASRPNISLLPSGSVWLTWRSETVQAGLSIFQDGAVSFGLITAAEARPTHINFAGSLERIMPLIAGNQSAQFIFH